MLYPPRVAVHTRRRGRVLIAAASSGRVLIAAASSGDDPHSGPAPFTATGLADEAVWAMLAQDQWAVTWELARQHRARRIRAAYRRRRHLVG